MRPSALALLLLAVGAGAEAAEPAARRTDVVDGAFGLSLPDPYRWMEGEGNAEFDAWLKAQGQATRARLDATPALATWRSRLASVASGATTHSRHTQVGDDLFFLRAPAGKERMIVVRGADGKDRVVYDPAQEPGASIRGFSVSNGGRLVAINLSRGGNEIGTLEVFDVATGRRRGFPLGPVWSQFTASWLPDDSGFFYTRMRAATGDDPLQGMAAYVHRLDAGAAGDRLIARAGDGSPLAIAASDFPSIGASPATPWAMLRVSGARASSRGCFAPLADAVAGRAAWRCLWDVPDAIQGGAIIGDTAYVLQAGPTPNRQLLAIDLRDPKASLANARVVVPERPDTVLSDVVAARDGLYLRSMQRGLDRLARVNPATGAATPIAFPIEGTMYVLDAHPQQDGAIVSIEGWTVPTRLYRLRDGVLQDTGLGTLGAPDYAWLVADEVEAPSADGTRVPLSIVYPRDLAKDGSARAILEGYGAYGVSYQPYFDATALEWAKAGNVYATCHVRGGGENGDAWRIGGSGPNKQRGVEDFIACAKELQARGFTVPARTAGYGGSMAGVLLGGAYTTAPQAWGAMAVQAGIFNPVRLLAAKNGANQIAEMGDPRTEDGLKQLAAMDPYQRVRSGAAYPPLMLVVGLADQRVAPWNSGKFGAAVMAVSPTTPVWIRTDEKFGHFATSLSSRAEEMADVFAFFEASMPGR